MPASWWAGGCAARSADRAWARKRRRAPWKRNQNCDRSPWLCSYTLGTGCYTSDLSMTRLTQPMGLRRRSLPEILLFRALRAAKSLAMLEKGRLLEGMPPSRPPRTDDCVIREYDESFNLQ